jgi:hypothetical protein
MGGGGGGVETGVLLYSVLLYTMTGAERLTAHNRTGRPETCCINFLFIMISMVNILTLNSKLGASINHGGVGTINKVLFNRGATLAPKFSIIECSGEHGN